MYYLKLKSYSKNISWWGNIENFFQEILSVRKISLSFFSRGITSIVYGVR